jgi:hypothetical protein
MRLSCFGNVFRLSRVDDEIKIKASGQSGALVAGFFQIRFATHCV